ncbi:MAG: hypothetical protein ABJB09_02300 [Verrucomicrobiota bacterium]
MLADISSATLRKMVKLSERKEALMSQIQELDRQMAALQETSTAQGEERRRTTRKTREARGALQTRIADALRASGAAGLTISQLSDKLKVKPANLYVWFNGTGRRTRGIKKLGPGKYRFSSPH